MRKGAEVTNQWLLNYRGNKYHVAHTRTNRLYLCGCMPVLPWGVRHRLHRTGRQKARMYL